MRAAPFLSFSCWNNFSMTANIKWNGTIAFETFVETEILSIYNDFYWF